MSARRHRATVDVASHLQRRSQSLAAGKGDPRLRKGEAWKGKPPPGGFKWKGPPPRCENGKRARHAG